MKKIINISDIRIRMNGPHDIVAHPYYLSLEKSDKSIYNEYVRSKATQRNKESGSWKSYIDLVNSIMFDGFRYNSKDPLILKKKKDGSYVCSHGRHRMCILYYVYKCDCRLEIKSIDQKNFEIIAILDPQSTRL
jgi:hypothetical protein